jgi:hypothetical protein
MPAQTNRAPAPAPAQGPIQTELAKSQKRAAIGLLDLVKSFGRVVPPRETVRLYQWAMGNLKTDGIIGPRTRARALALGALVPASADAYTDPERL